MSSSNLEIAVSEATVASVNASSQQLRLTRRGKAVLAAAAAAAVLSVMSVLLFGQPVTAAATSVAGEANYGYVVPTPGDSLWEIAERLDSAADPRDVVAELVRFNQLPSAELNAYEPIAVPSKYLGNPEVVTAAELGFAGQ